MVKGAEAEAKAKWMAVSLEGGDVAHALDRIQIPDEVRRSIAPHLTPGSTLIIGERSEYSAILPEGDDFLVSANDTPNNDTPNMSAVAEKPKAKQANAKLAKAKTIKVKHPQTARTAKKIKVKHPQTAHATVRFSPRRFRRPWMFSRW